MGFANQLLVLSLPLASSQQGGHAAERVPPLLDPEGIGLVFWTALTFIVVFALLRKYAWNPILDSLEGRERAIRDEIEQARRDRAEAGRVLREYEARLETSRTEAEKIIKEGADDKARLIREAHEKAVEETTATKARAVREIEMAKVKAIAEIRERTVTLAVDLASRVLRVEIDRSKHEELVESFLREYSKS